MSVVEFRYIEIIVFGIHNNLIMILKSIIYSETLFVSWF